VNLLRRAKTTTAAPYVVSSVLAAIVSISWFRTDFIASGDVGPFLRENLAGETGAVWNHQQTGAGSTSLDLGRAVEAWFYKLAGWLGGGPALGQRLLFVFVAVCIVVGVVHLCRLVTKSFSLLVIGGLLGLLNPWVALHHPNPVLLLAVGALAGLVGELLAPIRGGGRSALRLVLWSLPIAYLSLNPALLAVVLGVAILGAVVVVWRCEDRPTIARRFAVAVPLGLLAHAWWLVPFVWVSVTGVQGVEQTVVTDVRAWSWSHNQNSLENIVSLTAHWGWEESSFFPWTNGIRRFPWSLIRWVLPLGALAGLFVVRDRSVRLALAVAGVGSIVLMKGLHEPLSGLNQFLYDRVPGVWLLREPVSKVGPVLLLLEIVLFLVALEVLRQRRAGTQEETAEKTEPKPGAWSQRGALALGVLALSYSWPLVTGAAIPSSRGPLEGARVTVPADWQDVADAVNVTPGNGKVLILPVNDYYQVTTSWGFHGVDTVPQQMLRRPSVQLYPGGYFTGLPGYESLVRNAQDQLERGDLEAAAGSIRRLGVDIVIVRHDVVPGVLERTLPDSDSLASAVDELTATSLIADSPVAAAYSVAGVEPVQVGSRLVAVHEFGRPNQAVVQGLVGESVRSDIPAVDEVILVAGTSEPFSAPFDFADSSGPLRVERRRDGSVPTAVEVEQVLDGWKLSLVANDQVTIDGAEILGATSVEKIFEARPVALRMDGVEIPVEAGTPVMLRPGAEAQVFGVVAVGELGDWSDVGDCNAYDDRSISEVGIAGERSGATLTLEAGDHSACATRNVTFAGGGSYRLTMTAETSGVGVGRLCLWVDPGGCVVDEVLPMGAGPVSVVLDVEESVSNAVLFVYAAASGEGLVEASYESPAVERLEHIGQLDLSAIAEVTVVRADDIRAGVVSVGPSNVGSLLLGFGAVGNCNRIDDSSLEEVGISMTESNGVLELAAREHAGCTSARVRSVGGEEFYLLDFEYRTISGRGPRYCLWNQTESRCIADGVLSPETDWQRVSEQVDIPIGAQAELYLYADGHPATSRVQFRQVTVNLASTVGVSIAGVEREQRVVLTAEPLQHRPGLVTMEVEFSEPGSAALILTESFSEGWELAGLPDDWTAEHFEANGYANGWLLTGSGSATVEARFVVPAIVRASWPTRWLLFLLPLLSVVRLARARLSKNPSAGTEEARFLERAIPRVSVSRGTLLLLLPGLLVILAASDRLSKLAGTDT
jgi:arabinofuranan 3-O-arabinosyltransferase